MIHSKVAVFDPCNMHFIIISTTPGADVSSCSNIGSDQYDMVPELDLQVEQLELHRINRISLNRIFTGQFRAIQYKVIVVLPYSKVLVLYSKLSYKSQINQRPSCDAAPRD